MGLWEGEGGSGRRRVAMWEVRVWMRCGEGGQGRGEDLLPLHTAPSQLLPHTRTCIVTSPDYRHRAVASRVGRKEDLQRQTGLRVSLATLRNPLHAEPPHDLQRHTPRLPNVTHPFRGCQRVRTADAGWLDTTYYGCSGDARRRRLEPVTGEPSALAVIPCSVVTQRSYIIVHAMLAHLQHGDSSESSQSLSQRSTRHVCAMQQPQLQQQLETPAGHERAAIPPAL